MQVQSWVKMATKRGVYIQNGEVKGMGGDGGVSVRVGDRGRDGGSGYKRRRNVCCGNGVEEI